MSQKFGQISAVIVSSKNSDPQFPFETLQCNSPTTVCVKAEHVSHAECTVVPKHVVSATIKNIHEILLCMTYA